MSLLTTLKNLANPRDLFARSNSLTYSAGHSLVASSAALDLDTLVSDPLQNGVVAACVNAIAHALPDAPLLLENRTPSGWREVHDHECLRVLRAPNPDHSDADVWGLTSGYKATRGQAFWLLLPDTRGQVGEIHVWNPDRVTTLGNENQFIAAYRVQKENGTFFEADKRQIIHFRHLPDFHNPRLGWNPLRAGRAHIAGDNLGAAYHTSILHNAGVVSLLISLKEGAATGQVTPEQFQSVLSNLRRASRERAGGVEGINLPLEVHKLAYSPDEMNVDKLIEGYEMRICSVMGVSQRVAGLGSDPTYNNLGEALTDFWERRIVPDRNSDAATLNRQWLPLWNLDDGNWRFRFDYSGVPALQENRDGLHARVRADWEKGLVDKKRARALLGYAGDENSEGSFASVFYGVNKGNATGDATKAVWSEADHPRNLYGEFENAGSGSSVSRQSHFEDLHTWTGDDLSEKETRQFQEGKAEALKKLLPYTNPKSNEAAIIILKKDGRQFGKIATGQRDNVQISAPYNVPVAHFHTHDYDGPHSEGDWADFIIHRGQDQAHIITANKTYSLHKPIGWSAEDHGLPEFKISDGQEQLDKMRDIAEDAFIEQWKQSLQDIGGVGLTGWQTKISIYACQKMAQKLGLIFSNRTKVKSWTKN